MGDKGRGGRLDWLPLAWKPGLSLRRHADGRVIGRFLSAHLTSLYQPIIEIASDRVIGSEAFVRCHNADEVGLSPWNLFSLVADDDTLVGLDRLCRTLHVLNNPEPIEHDALLFLNVHGRLLPAVAEDHGHAFRRVLMALDRPSANIVIETPTAACADPKLLAFVLSNYRLNGFKVGANVASARDLESVLREVRPNFVKIDSRTFSKTDESFVFDRHQAGPEPAPLLRSWLLRVSRRAGRPGRCRYQLRTILNSDNIAPGGSAQMARPIENGDSDDGF